MSKKEDKSSWDELAKLLGTQTSNDTTQPLQPESVSNFPSEPRISARPVRPRHSDWNVLASELGLSLPAAPPPRSAESTPKTPPVVPETPPVAPEALPVAPALERTVESQPDIGGADEVASASEFQRGELPYRPSSTSSTEIVASSRPQNLFEDGSEMPSAIFPQEATGPPWPEILIEPLPANEIEPGSMALDAIDVSVPSDTDTRVPATPPKESRRRRRGGRRRSAAAKRTQTTAEASPETQGTTQPSDITAPREKHVRTHSGDVSDASSIRKKRRRRNGGDRRSKASEMPADTPTKRPRETAAETRTQTPWDPASNPLDAPATREPKIVSKSAKTHRRNRRRSEPGPEPTQSACQAPSRPGQHVPEFVLDEEMEDSDRSTDSSTQDSTAPVDPENQLSGKRSIHKNIPTWEETVGILIDNNLTTRTPRNRSQRSGSKGGRRGRKR